MRINKVVCSLLFLTIFSCPGLSNASSGNFYIAGHYTAEFPTGETFGVDEAGQTASAAMAIRAVNNTTAYNPNYKLGHLGSLMVGYSYAGNPRVEVEGFIMSTNTKDDDTPRSDRLRYLRNTAVATDYIEYANTGFKGIGVMLNAYYDVISNDLPVVPYIGGGAGIARMEFLSQTRNGLAFQGKAGVSMSLAPKIRAFAGYRYLMVTEGDGFTDIAPTSGNVQGAVTTANYGNLTIKVPYASHGLEFGVIAAM